MLFIKIENKFINFKNSDDNSSIIYCNQRIF